MVAAIRASLRRPLVLTIKGPLAAGEKPRKQEPLFLKSSVSDSVEFIFNLVSDG